jgi:DNA-binding MarR family transcriptional regulator
MLRTVTDTYDQLALDRQLCFALYAASRSVVQTYGPLLGELGLTYPQYVALLVLWEADEPMTVGAIGRRLRLDTGTLTPLLKRLEAMGLVRRTRDTADERRVLVELTDAGGALRDQAASIPRRLIRQTGLSVDEVVDLRARLVELIGQLDDAVERRADGPPTP